MPGRRTDQHRLAAVHAFLVGGRDDDADSIAFRIVGSAGYRRGLVPDDPELQAAATFATAQGTQPAVYASDGHHSPTRWIRFDAVVPLPASDGSPVLRFTASDGSVLPAEFRDAARRVRRVVLVDVVADSGETQRTTILFVTDRGPQV